MAGLLTRGRCYVAQVPHRPMDLARLGLLVPSSDHRLARIDNLDEEVAAGFPNGRQLIVERAGHGELAADPEIMDAIVKFLRGEANVPDRVVLSPLRFRRPS